MFSMTKQILAVFTIVAIAAMMGASSIAPAFAANTANYNSVGKSIYTSGYDNGVYWFVQANEGVNTQKGQSANDADYIYVAVYDFNTSSYCSDFINDPAGDEVKWNWNKAKITADTACGPVDVTIVGDGNIIKYDGTWSFGADNCSAFSVDYDFKGRYTYGDASGTINGMSVDNDWSSYILKGNSHYKVCTA